MKNIKLICLLLVILLIETTLKLVDGVSPNEVNSTITSLFLVLVVWITSGIRNLDDLLGWVKRHRFISFYVLLAWGFFGVQAFLILPPAENRIAGVLRVLLASSLFVPAVVFGVIWLRRIFIRILVFLKILPDKRIY